VTGVKIFKIEQRLEGIEDLYRYLIKNVESLGELIVLASVLDIDIIVLFLPKITQVHLESINWLQKICNEDTQFIIGEIDLVFQPKNIN